MSQHILLWEVSKHNFIETEDKKFDYFRLDQKFGLSMICLFFTKDREAELLKPIEDVVIYEKESASFDCEISEADVPGEWKLKGETLRPSPVRFHIVVKYIIA